jgi:uncharacterized protein (DUF983 family)
MHTRRRALAISRSGDIVAVFPMSITRSQIIARGLKGHCPNCGQPSLFPRRSFMINRRCPACGVGLDRGPGFFLGPWVINYSIAVFVFVLPGIMLGVRGVIPWWATLVLAAIGCLIVPALLYRRTWSWWLMLYFFFQPLALPANGGPTGTDEED